MNYMLARDSQFLELQSPGNKKLLKVSDLVFELEHMGFNTFPYPIQELRDPNFHCKQTDTTTSRQAEQFKEIIGSLIYTKKSRLASNLAEGEV